MSKKSKFGNRAARRFNNIDKIDTMSQEEIFDILTGDMKIMLDQVTAFRQHKPNSPYPAYICNAFANISTAYYFFKFVKTHVKIGKKNKIKTDLDKDELESLRQIIADAYKRSVTNGFQNQALDYRERMKYLGKAFIRLCPDKYALTRKITGLTRQQRRDLTVQVYGDPVYNIRQVARIFDVSSVSEKKKMRVLKMLYGKKKRVVAALGAALTIDSTSSDFTMMVFDHIMDKKKWKRFVYFREYARAFKKNKSRFFRIDQDFLDKHKKLIKLLIKHDRGFKKAFRVSVSKNKDGKSKDNKREKKFDRK